MQNIATSRQRSPRVKPALIPVSFADRLRRERAARGYSQSRLAQALGVSVATVCGWEKGRMRPKVDRMKALADLLDLSYDALETPARSVGLTEYVAHSRETIAQLAGTSTDKVHIIIEI